MKGDRELCTAAVAQSWRALEFASQEMKGDRELCMAAVAQNGKYMDHLRDTIAHMSDEMKGDEEVPQSTS